MTKVKNAEKWVAGLGLPLVSRTKPCEPPECLILEDLQTLHIRTNKKLEIWTQYRLLLSFLGGYFFLSLVATSLFPWWLLLFFQEYFEAKGDLYKILKSGKNPEKSLA